MTIASRLSSAEQRALDHDRLIDMTTIGRRSGKPSRIETGFFRHNGAYYLSGLPGKRDWYANLRANPDFTIHLKQGATADIAATAHPVTDPAERESVIRMLVTKWGQLGRLQEFLDGSPLLRVTIQGTITGENRT
jgi:deazaflavin-dependent oxidoreductase (nitroreductase family)